MTWQFWLLRFKKNFFWRTFGYGFLFRSFVDFKISRKCPCPFQSFVDCFPCSFYICEYISVDKLFSPPLYRKSSIKGLWQYSSRGQQSSRSILISNQRLFILPSDQRKRLYLQVVTRNRVKKLSLKPQSLLQFSARSINRKV